MSINLQGPDKGAGQSSSCPRRRSIRCAKTLL